MTSSCNSAGIINISIASRYKPMFLSKRDQHEFKPLLVEIDEEPLNPLGRLIYWVILGALLFVSLWMFFGQVDVVVTARGKVIPTGDVKIIQPLTSGVVSNIMVTSGQLVEAGEVLMEINPTDTEPELASMQADLKLVELEMLRIKAMLAGEQFAPQEKLYDPGQLDVQKQLYQSGLDKLTRQIQLKLDELDQIAQQLAGAQKSIDQNAYLQETGRSKLDRLEPVRDLVSHDEYDRARIDVTTYDNQLASARYKLEELQATKAQVMEQIRLIEEETRQDLLQKMAEKRQKMLYLEAKIERTGFVNARQQIRSPVRGHITQLLVHTIGGVVTPAEKLAVVVPTDSTPVIKAQVLNRDVGYLTPGMDVAIKVDTFEFQKYGMLHGRLLHVARDSVMDEHLGLVYDAYIEPLETTLQVGGVTAEVTNGMSVSAEVKVGKRRMIEFFIYPLIKYLDEGTSVR
jgi:membrane fusion protein, hemolysin D